jgi:hypothetical protein
MSHGIILPCKGSEQGFVVLPQLSTVRFWLSLFLVALLQLAWQHPISILFVVKYFLLGGFGFVFPEGPFVAVRYDAHWWCTGEQFTKLLANKYPKFKIG